MEIDSEMLEHRSEVNENSEDEMEGFEAEKLLAAVSKNKSGGFQALGLSHNILKGIQKKGYKQPTPIQRKVRYNSNSNMPILKIRSVLFSLLVINTG